MAAKKKTTAKKSSSSPKARAKVGKVMHEFKHGELKSGGKRKVKNPKQAIAIGLSEARRAGANVPAKKKTAAKRSGGAATTSAAKTIRRAREESVTMETAIDRAFLRYSAEKLRQLSSRIETCLRKLNEEQVWARGSENENAVGNLVLHLCGNVRQWIVSGIGGRPDVRERDKEFSARGGLAIAELAGLLQATVAEAVATLETLNRERLAERVVIQGYDESVLEAVYHVVEHFSGHTGQIVFATKLLTGSDLGFYRHLRGAAHGETTP